MITSLQSDPLRDSLFLFHSPNLRMHSAHRCPCTCLMHEGFIFGLSFRHKDDCPYSSHAIPVQEDLLRTFCLCFVCTCTCTTKTRMEGAAVCPPCKARPVGLVTPTIPPNSLNRILSHMITLKNVLEAVVTERGLSPRSLLTTRSTRHLVSSSPTPPRPSHAEDDSVIYILTDSESED